VRQIVVTHWHPDHWMSYDAVRAATGAPVLVGAKEINIPEERIDGRLADGDTVPIGGATMEVIHTPGHTPGSISLRLGRAVIAGDTLFNGGPGKTFARGDLEVLVQSIVSRLHPLPEETVVLPGHGVSTTIGESRKQYAEYVRRPHAPGYFGDVEWLKGGS
jgi:glyoxylase-like metal-dependent hydrolase (beta-lactamase superfamily II)